MSPLRGWAVCGLVILMLLGVGCSRTRYRKHADRQSYSILQQKTHHKPWQTNPAFTIQPDQRARFYDPSPIDDPQLWLPAPQLYKYDIPELSSSQQRQMQPPPEQVPPGPPGVAPPGSAPYGPAPLAAPPSVAAASVGPRAARPVFAAPRIPGQRQFWPASLRASQDPAELFRLENDGSADIPIPPLPPEYWQPIPQACLARMAEFAGIRAEYEKSFQRPLTLAEESTVRRLSFEDIVELALFNSREYQARKEQLYRDALRLSLVRFDYQLKFSRNANRTAANYSHSRNGGVTVNTLGVPTQAQVDKMLATGGDFLARFANSVVLEFNGPQGFAADVGSDLLLDLSQTIFQRDIRLEALTQAERDVVYSAREFARLSQDVFISSWPTSTISCCSVIVTLKSIRKNYFSLIRGFLAREAEFQAGEVSRIDVDQLEQQVLSARSRLLTSCNGLERSLDNLKITLGLPTETPLNLVLSELGDLTMRDRIAVTGDLIRRSQRRVTLELASPSPDRLALLRAGIVDFRSHA